MPELTFKDKEFVYNHHLAVLHRFLVQHPKKGIGKANLDGYPRRQPGRRHAELPLCGQHPA